jgi:hypothetical protein
MIGRIPVKEVYVDIMSYNMKDGNIQGKIYFE